MNGSDWNRQDQFLVITEIIDVRPPPDSGPDDGVWTNDTDDEKQFGSVGGTNITPSNNLKVPDYITVPVSGYHRSVL